MTHVHLCYHNDPAKSSLASLPRGVSFSIFKLIKHLSNWSQVKDNLIFSSWKTPNIAEQTLRPPSCTRAAPRTPAASSTKLRRWLRRFSGRSESPSRPSRPPASWSLAWSLQSSVRNQGRYNYLTFTKLPVLSLHWTISSAFYAIPSKVGLLILGWAFEFYNKSSWPICFQSLRRLQARTSWWNSTTKTRSWTILFATCSEASFSIRILISKETGKFRTSITRSGLVTCTPHLKQTSSSRSFLSLDQDRVRYFSFPGC